MTEVASIGGPISPKSVDASGTGLVFAQNMMYRHTMTVYNSSGELVTPSPTRSTAQFGVAGHPGVTHGAPGGGSVHPGRPIRLRLELLDVRRRVGPEGSDTCTPASARAAGDTPSYVYRVSPTLAIDQVIQVGLVPK